MSKDKFVFEWRVGDQAKHIPTGGLGWIVGPSDKNINETWKPRGKTKKRYKAEKLKWQQSRMKVGDWVKLIKDQRVDGLGNGFSGKPFKIQNESFLPKYFEDSDGYWHYPARLKPCKPPKPEKPVLESENFRIEDERLIFTQNGYSANWGDINDSAFDGEQSYIPFFVDGNENSGCGVLTSDRLREIATLLDRSTASRK